MSLIEEPRLRLDDPTAPKDCFLCGKLIRDRLPDGSPNAPYCEDDPKPRMYFHGACGVGRPYELILALASKARDAIFRGVGLVLRPEDLG